MAFAEIDVANLPASVERLPRTACAPATPLHSGNRGGES
jgi:hypothetical protein